VVAATRGISGDEGDKVRIFFELTPVFKIYHESESSTWNLGFSPSFRYKDIKESIRKERELETVFGLKGNLNKYINTSFFFKAGGELNGYIEKRLKGDRPECSLGYDFEYEAHLSPYIGIGIGRIRDVTPIFMALRMNERLKALGWEEGLPADRVQRIAQTIAKRNGYISVHDRSDKYFWGDLYKLFEGPGRRLDAFDYYYLSEPMIEMMGQRRSGWEVFLKAALMQLYRRWECLPEVSKSSAEVSILGRWVRNLSLNHMLELRAETRYIFSIDKDASDYAEGCLDLGAEHLWIITDRLMLDTNLGAVLVLKEADKYFYGRYGIDEVYMVDVDFHYFVEDNLSVTSSAEVRFYPDIPSNSQWEERLPWSYYVGFRYYPWRKLN